MFAEFLLFYLLQFDASKLSMDSIYWTRSTEWQ